MRKEGRAVLFAVVKSGVCRGWMDKQNGAQPNNGMLFGLRKDGHWFSLIPAAAAVAPVFSGSLRYFPFTSRNVVANVAACGVITVFNDVKVCKSSSPADEEGALLPK